MVSEIAGKRQTWCLAAGDESMSPARLAEHRAALEWAARRAVRDGSRLELVFVLQHSGGDEADGPSDLLVLAQQYGKKLPATATPAALATADLVASAGRVKPGKRVAASR